MRSTRILAVALAAPLVLSWAGPLSSGRAGAAVDSECRAGNAAGATVLAQVEPVVQRYLGVHRLSTTPGVSLAIVGPTPGAPDVASVAIVNCGVTAEGGSDPVTSDTSFEIGSETKTFTALALAQLVLDGRVSLGDVLQQFVPVPYVVPSDPCSSPGAPITLQQLATHNAGLQDDPRNKTWNFVESQGHDLYSRTRLWESFTSGWAPACEALLSTPGTEYSYSNWGFALLGTVLADVYAPNGAGVPNYATMVRELITDRLGMSATRLSPIASVAGAAVPTCSRPAGTPPGEVPATPCAWNNTNAFAGAGGLVSTISDMAAFTAANLGFDRQPGIWPAIELTHQSLGIGPSCVTCQGLAWAITPPGAPLSLSPFTMLSKDGGTWGMHSHTYLLPDACWGLTVLSNSNEADPVGTTGFAGEIIRALGPTNACPKVAPAFTG